MCLLFADFINECILPGLDSIPYILLEHPLFLPLVLIVFLMGQDGADIYFTPIVIDRSNEPCLVAPNIEDGQLTNFIRSWEHSTHFYQRGKIVLLHIKVRIDIAPKAVVDLHTACGMTRLISEAS